MDAVSYTNFRQNLKRYMQQLKDDAAPITVTAKDPDDNMVVMNQRVFDAIQETLRIMSNPELTEKIRRGQQQFAKTGGLEHELFEDFPDD